MEWISVNEKLPKEKQYVLTYWADDYMCICRLYDGIWETLEEGYQNFVVTHWMTLPNKPE